MFVSLLISNHSPTSETLLRSSLTCHRPWQEIFNSLKHYYSKEILSQIYKIIGSLDVFGNPTMVISSFWKGAHDFVLQPFREFMRSPKNPSRIGVGVAKGILSLLSHFTSGVFGFISNVSLVQSRLNDYSHF